MFVKLTAADVLIEDVIHPAGDVVEVDEVRGKYLVDHGQGTPHDGPASHAHPREPKATTAAAHDHEKKKKG